MISAWASHFNCWNPHNRLNRIQMVCRETAMVSCSVLDSPAHYQDSCIELIKKEMLLNLKYLDNTLHLHNRVY